MIDAALLLVAFVVILASSAIFASLLRSERRQAARERDLLINQLLHAAGRTWQPPPADRSDPWALPEPRMWTPSPEQLPVD